MSGFDRSEILPKLWVGSDPPSGPALAVSGVQCLILCAKELFRPQAAFPGVAVVGHVPLEDDPTERGALSLAELEFAFAGALVAARALRSNQTVLCTCAAGVNRSAFVVGTTIRLLGLTVPNGDLIAWIRHRRKAPCGMRALSNPHFRKALSGESRAFNARLQKARAFLRGFAPGEARLEREETPRARLVDPYGREIK